MIMCLKSTLRHHQIHPNDTAILPSTGLEIKGARDQRYLRRASGLAVPDIVHSINFVHLPVSIHTDASADKKAKQ